MEIEIKFAARLNSMRRRIYSRLGNRVIQTKQTVGIARRADCIICIADKNTRKIATWIRRTVTPALSSDARRKSDGGPQG